MGISAITRALLIRELRQVFAARERAYPPLTTTAASIRELEQGITQTEQRSANTFTGRILKDLALLIQYANLQETLMRQP